MKHAVRTLAVIFCCMTIWSCSDDDEPMVQIDNPVDYTFTRTGLSTVSFGGQTDRLGMSTELINGMKDFSIDAMTLVEMYANETEGGGDANPFNDALLNLSTKSVKSKVAASNNFFSSNTTEAAEIKADLQSWIEGQVTDVFPNQGVLAAAGVAGQIADGTSVRYVNEKGLEYNQAVNKSLIGALMVDQICNNYLSTQVLDADENRVNNDNVVLDDGNAYTTMEHKWDEAYGYLFGASTNPADPLANLGEDSFLNKYLKRVDDDSDFSGIANEIFEAFKLGRAAIVANDYVVRDQQANILREKISEVIGIRAVYYLQNGKRALENQDFGGAFHDLSEGFGFVYSLRFTRKPNSADSYFTKSEVDNMIDQLMVGNGFWDVSSQTLNALSEAITANFNFTLAQAAD